MTAKESGTSKLLEQSPLGLQAVASCDLISLVVRVERRNWWAKTLRRKSNLLVNLRKPTVNSIGVQILG